MLAALARSIDGSAGTAPSTTGASTIRCSVASSPGTMPIARTRTRSPLAAMRRSSTVGVRAMRTVSRARAGYS